MSWNIFHNFALKLTDPEQVKTDVPVGYTLISLPRKPRLRDQRRGGGVALLIRHTSTFTMSELSAPDILVLDLGSIWLIGAYIPPESSRWEGWTDIAPLDKFWETVALCTQSDDKYLPIGHTTTARHVAPAASASILHDCVRRASTCTSNCFALCIWFFSSPSSEPDLTATSHIAFHIFGRMHVDHLFLGTISITHPTNTTPMSSAHSEPEWRRIGTGWPLMDG
ncbi:hypothetical protein K438DRAFT_498538 [Mycena galopus ATCC 62051]|nr:hypothetical protein K438DRAFT_498538 [Mycena galopus ATCC 62051]